MSVKRNTIGYGIAAAVLALVIIAASAFIASNNLVPSPSASGQASGQLDVLLTDPPTVPNGVTGVYVTYTNVGVHIRGAGNQSGWTGVSISGTIDLMKLVNVSTTLASLKVTSGFYNALRFNISSAKVAFNGANYTAFVPRAQILVAIPGGGIPVNASKTSAAIIDMYPTVINIGTKSVPEFIITTTASCFRVPGEAITKALDKRGFELRLDIAQWWEHISNAFTSNIAITGATLKNNSLSVTVKNTGTQNVTLGFASVESVGNLCTPSDGDGHGGRMKMPLCFTGSAFFAILDNGTMRSVSTMDYRGFSPQLKHGPKDANIFGDFGYTLTVGKSVTLTYGGLVTLGFRFMGTPISVTPTQQYSITVVGQQALAEYVVVAT
jgi:hypothetical protein